ncbi:MAG: hypothetical protein AAGJ37_03640 [Pseudomonadota bacterium]
MEIWQSETLIDIALFADNASVDAQEDFNKISVLYPFSRRPSSDQIRALELTKKIITFCGGSATYQSEPFKIKNVLED